MKRSATQASTQTVTTTVVKKAKPGKSQVFRVPAWAGKSKTGFPKELHMKHRYCEVIQIGAVGGAVQNYSFIANGMFDPNHSGTGHQPLYFDQLSAIYNHYVVLNSKITVKATVVGTVTQPVALAVYVNDDTTVTPASPQIAAEQSSAKYGTVLPDGNGTLTLVNRYSAKQNFGPGAISDPNLQGTVSANPTEVMAFTISGQAIDLVSTWGTYCFVTIEYDVVWQELRDIGAS